MAPGSPKCAAKDCVNRRGEGSFVGDFCLPCDRALRSGKTEHGTSWIFAMAADLTHAERDVTALSNECERRFNRIRELEAALNEARILIARVNVTWVHRDQLALDIGAYIARTTAETVAQQPDEYAAHSPECYLRKYREGYCDCELPQSDRGAAK